MNPELEFWESDLRFCIEHPQVRGVRLYPGYHDFAVDERFVLATQVLDGEPGAGIDHASVKLGHEPSRDADRVRNVTTHRALDFGQGVAHLPIRQLDDR